MVPKSPLREDAEKALDEFVRLPLAGEAEEAERARDVLETAAMPHRGEVAESDLVEATLPPLEPDDEGPQNAATAHLPFL